MKEPERMNHKLLIIVLLFSCSLVSSCTLIKVGVSSLHSKDIFVQLETDKRVFVEPGAELYAEQVALHLDKAISVVEEKQYRPFNSPIVIYVCATQESFSKFSAASKKARASVTLKKVYISPKLIKKGEIQDQIIHEFSHLHLEQQMGSYTYYSNIPYWFQEGLAMFVSNGSGLAAVDNKKLQKHLLDGNTFEPVSSGSVFFRSDGYPRKKMTGLMWLWQVESFVKYLHSIGGTQFKNFLLSFQDGISFEQAFEKSYGNTIQSIWEKYLVSFKKT